MVLAKVSQRKKLLEIIIYSIMSLFIAFFTSINITFAVYGYSWNLNKVVADAYSWGLITLLILTCIFYFSSGIYLIYRLSSISKGMKKDRYQGKKKYKYLAISIVITFFNVLIAIIITLCQTQKSIQNNFASNFGLSVLFVFDGIVFSYVLLFMYSPNSKKLSSSASHNSSKKFVEMDTQSNNSKKNYSQVD